MFSLPGRVVVRSKSAQIYEFNIGSFSRAVYFLRTLLVPPRRLPEDLRAILVIPKGRFQVLEGRRGGDFSFGTHERLERMEESLREQFGVGVPLACFDGVVLEFPHIKGKRWSCLFPKREGRQVWARAMMSRNELSGTPNSRAIWLSGLGFFRHRFLSYASNIRLRSSTV